ncbi:SDR family NAD(P)-dependent oxidoreductase [Pseudomonas sp.]|uniref:SDR family NAD(P)-dependent oxidoreductase n=1 Tax=Pseudomonas sp. TaxID=306 RepID=UPI00272C113D|nr:SDR family NAD(P)-dependent oxidoreductase [Pseudomonas sp.]
MDFRTADGSPAQVLVTGASRGIGKALVDALLAEAGVGRVFAVARNWPEAPQRDGRIVHINCDLTRSEDVQRLRQRVVAAVPRLDLVINCAGFLHERAGQQPEKSLSQLSLAGLQRSFEINAFAPILLAQALLPLLRGTHRCVFASLSARVGSIGDNRLGGWYAYRASKSAQNMLLRTFAIEWQRLNRSGICLLLHPGTTDTELSRPFQARVPAGKLFTVDFVAERLLEIIARSAPEDTGRFYAWDGQPIPW